MQSAFYARIIVLPQIEESIRCHHLRRNGGIRFKAPERKKMAEKRKSKGKRPNDTPAAPCGNLRQADLPTPCISELNCEFMF